MPRRVARPLDVRQGLVEFDGTGIEGKARREPGSGGTEIAQALDLQAAGLERQGDALPLGASGLEAKAREVGHAQPIFRVPSRIEERGQTDRQRGIVGQGAPVEPQGAPDIAQPGPDQPRLFRQGFGPGRSCHVARQGLPGLRGLMEMSLVLEPSCFGNLLRLRITQVSLGWAHCTPPIPLLLCWVFRPIGVLP